MFDSVDGGTWSTRRSAGAIILALIALFCAVTTLWDLADGRARLTVDPSLDALLPKAGREVEALTTIHTRFYSDDQLFVVWLGEDVVTADGLRAFKSLARSIERIPGVEHVESLATALRTQVFDDYSVVDAYLATVPDDDGVARALAMEARANPLYAGYLVATDGDGATIAVRFERGLDARAMLAIVDRIDAAAAATAVARGSADIFLAGPLHARLALARQLLDDLVRVMLLAVAATLAVAALFFRHIRGVLLPFAANVVAVMLCLALFVANGHTLNYVTVILAPTTYVIGFAYAVHIICDFDRHLVAGCDRVTAVGAAMKEVSTPLLLTALTTALGFTALTLSDISAIRVFGWYAALGTVTACAMAFLVVPAGLVLLPARTAAGRPIAARAVEELAALAQRHARVLFVSAVVIGLGGLLAATGIRVNTDYLQNFAPDSPVRQDFVRLNDQFAGAVPLQVVVSGEADDTFKTLDGLRAIAALQSWLRAQPEIGGVYSLVDYVDEIERVLAPELVDDKPLPVSTDILRHLILLGASEDIRRFADPAFRSSLLQVRVRVVASAELNALTARIRAHLQTLPNGLQGEVTGSAHLVAHTLDAVTRGQIFSLLGAVVPIFLVLVVVFGSLRLAAMALLPNLMPLIAFFGILGVSGVPLNLTTSLVAAAVLGIAVDDTIHLLVRLRSAAQAGDDAGTALRVALGAVLRPVTCTTFALVAGFATLYLGQITSLREFGLLAALTLLIAWILDLIITPALALHSGMAQPSGKSS